MAAQNRKPRGVVAAFLGFIGLSVIAAVLATAAVTPALAVTGMAATDTIGMFENLPAYLKLDQLAQATTIYAKNSKGKDVQIAKFWAQNRVEVGWNDVSQYVKDAAVAVEDQRFYEHGGVDIQGTLRGIVSTLMHHDVQGGSSITQQYVKNVLVQQCVAEYTDNEQKLNECYDEVASARNPDGTLAIDRKIQEMKYAIALEKTTPKDKILLGYLNISPFGGSVYGIEAAAKYYYGVSAKDVTLAQAASLVAIVNNPNNLRLDEPDSEANGKANGYAANKQRRDLILNDMLAQGKITKEEYSKAIDTKIEPKITPSRSGCASAGNAAFFCDSVVNIIKNDPAFGETRTQRWANFNRGGYTIHTTLNLELQKADYKALTSRIPAVVPGDGNEKIAGSAVAVEPGTGRVLAMVQTKKYSQDPETLKNPAYTAINLNDDYNSIGFQVGSTYKTFALADWLDKGHSLYEVVNGTKFNFDQSTFRDSCGGPWHGVWKVENDQAGEAGYMTALNATVHSVNTAYAAITHALDTCDIKNMAAAMGVHRADGDPLTTNPSATLGTNEIAPITIATAYAGIANGGKWCKPVFIDSIKDALGNAVEPPKQECTQGWQPKLAAGVAYALQQVVRRGTAAGSYIGDGIAVLGKTGTTNENQDTWLTESSTKVATSYWLGNIKGDVNLRTVYLDGTRADFLRTAIMQDMMTAANDQFGGAKEFPQPDSKMLYGVKVSVPSLTGKSPSEAKQLLEAIGLNYKDGGETNSSLAQGLVAGTDPGAGAEVTKGSAVTVYTSNGKMNQLPDVRGQDEATAVATLNSAGFANVVKQEIATDQADQNGKVISQNPAPGPADPSVTVTIYLGKYTAPPGTGDGTGGGNDGKPGKGGDKP